MKKFKVIILICVIKIIYCDKSDDECGIILKNAEPANATNDDISLALERLKPVPKKSLVIVFDTTGSMEDDLKDLRSAAVDITELLRKHPDNPIGNYILSKFNDPFVYDVIETKDPDILIKELNQMTAYGGNNNCAERCLIGIKNAIEVALPNSFIYVFTDADTHDKDLTPAVIDIIQKKQLTVNFLSSTRTCEGVSPNSFDTYVKLTSVGNGQIFDLTDNSEISKVLTGITTLLDNRYQTLKTFKHVRGSSKTNVKVDSSFTELIVTMTGTKAKLDLKNSRNETMLVKSGGVDTDNNKFMMFDVNDSEFVISAEAQSDYKINVGGMSDLKISFGFSVEIPNSQVETSTQPLINEKNYLSIFVKDPKNEVKCLVKATISPLNDKEFESFELKLIKKGNFYVSDSAEMPTKLFTVSIFGYDSKGNEIDRRISTGIEPVKGSPPIVYLSHNYPESEANQGREFVVNCHYISLTSSEVYLYHNGELLESRNSRQSSELVYLNKKFDLNDVGTYKCVVDNGIEQISKEFKIDIRLAPIVNVEPKSITVKREGMINLTCEISNIREESTIFWKNDHKVIKEVQNFNQKTLVDTLELKVNENDDKKNITCEIKDGYFEEFSSSELSVQYPPKFKTGISETQTAKRSFDIGKDEELRCETEENPEGNVNWFFYKEINPDNRTDLNHTSKIYKINEFTQKKRGHYVCEVENLLGKVSKDFKVLSRPVDKPNINTNTRIVVNEGEILKLKCSCEDCLPIINKNFWIKKSQNTSSDKYYGKQYIENIEEYRADKFTTTLFYKNRHVATESDIGYYNCTLENKLGSDSKLIYVVVQSKPKFINILGDGRKIDLKIEINDFKDLNLTSSSYGVPQPYITIYKDDEVISKSSNLLIKRENLKNVKGNYTFESRNSLGLIYKSVEIDVKIPPRVMKNHKRFHKITLEKDSEDTIELYCDIEGFPEPKFQWSFNEKLMKDSFVYQITDEKYLKFILSKETKGNYICSGNNGISDGASINFEVLMNEPPWFEKSEETIFLEIHSKLEIDCDVQGQPKPGIKWMKDNKTLNTPLSYVKIPKMQDNNKKKDYGNYTCEASNKFGSATKVFHIKKKAFPEVTSKFEDIKILFNETRSIKCNGLGSPWPKFTWKNNGKDISNKQKLELDSSLDSGILSCHVENMFGKSHKSFNFKVIRVPYLTTNVTETNFTPKRFESLTLECPIKDCDEIKWEHDDEITKTYILRFVDSPDSDKYKCNCSNELGSVSHQFDVKVLIEPEGHIIFLESTRSPSLPSNMDTSYIQPYSKLIMKCETSGFPLPKITWFKNKTFISEKSEISFEMATYEEDGIYECRVENSEGSFDSSSQHIFVAEAPKIANFTQKLNEKSHSVSCFAHGYPIPKVYIIEGREVFDENSNDVKIMEHGHNGTEIEVSIDVHRKQDFKCIAENNYGKVEKSIHVEKIEKEFLKFKYENENINMEVEVFQNDDVDLNCEYEGEPKPTVSWFDFNLNDYLNETLEILKVKRIQLSNDIACSVSNSKIRLQRNFKIKIKDVWSEFGEFSPCSVECGGGYKTRSKHCIAPIHLCGEKTEIIDYEYCSTGIKCPSTHDLLIN